MVGDPAYLNSDEDSALETLEDPSVDRKEWRLRKAASPTGDRTPPGSAGIRKIPEGEGTEKEQRRQEEEAARWQAKVRRAHEEEGARWHA